VLAHQAQHRQQHISHQRLLPDQKIQHGSIASLRTATRRMFLLAFSAVMCPPMALLESRLILLAFQILVLVHARKCQKM
jgi:hypothetical protein